MSERKKPKSKAPKKKLYRVTAIKRVSVFTDVEAESPGEAGNKVLNGEYEDLFGDEFIDLEIETVVEADDE